MWGMILSQWIPLVAGFIFEINKKKTTQLSGPTDPAVGRTHDVWLFILDFPGQIILKHQAELLVKGISGQNLCSVALPSQISTRFGVMPDRTTNIHLGMAGRSSSDHDWKTQVKGPRGPTRSQYPPVLSYVALETPPLIDERIPAKTLHFHGDVPIPTFYQRVSHKAISKQGTNRQAPKRCM